MKKIFHTTIVCLLIPSLVFAQIPHYSSREPAFKQTDLDRVWNALNTEVGQQIVSYIETTVGSIDLENVKAFSFEKGAVAFVPIKSFSKVLAALCYRQFEDGSEYLFLITYNAEEKAVSLSFPSGQMFIMKSSEAIESANPGFQFQEYGDLNNKVEIILEIVIRLLCLPMYLIVYVFFSLYLLGQYFIVNFIPWASYIYTTIMLTTFLFVFPLWFNLKFIVPAFPNSDLAVVMASIIFWVYYYTCQNVVI